MQREEMLADLRRDYEAAIADAKWQVARAEENLRNLQAEFALRELKIHEYFEAKQTYERVKPIVDEGPPKSNVEISPEELQEFIKKREKESERTKLGFSVDIAAKLP